MIVTSIAEGTRREIQASIESLGADRIDVISGTMNGVKNAALPFGGLYMLKDKDVEDINRIAGVRMASGMLRGSADASFGISKSTLAWIGGGPGIVDILGYEIQQGRNFTEAESSSARRIVLLGEATSAKLFGKTKPIGLRVRINGSAFIVIGTMKRRGISVAGQDLDEIAIVPIRSARRNLMGDFPLPPNALQQISLRFNNGVQENILSERIAQRLRKTHKLAVSEILDFRITGVAESVKVSGMANRAMSLLLISVAAICLFVGGIGVMNIMLVSISERIGEIGLRMSLGASPNNICQHFLAESVLLSSIGGGLGALFGIIGSHLITRQQGLATQINLLVLIIAIVVTIATGVVFGMWPALQAARMLPAEALRRL
ncbi:ABC transporter permease [Xanthomonas vasicola]|uniref:ABC transporter permease n=1 Tax=Xanthomonas vasicola TaxID=56459 RepID=UPI001E36C798|nr:ABC transporter permease [Xanthomonas vasicola]